MVLKRAAVSVSKMIQDKNRKTKKVELANREILLDDFAVSRLYRVRRAIQKDPFGAMLFFVPIVLLWSALMSYGALIHGSNSFVVQYTPNIALYCGAIGVLVFPLRYVWLPLLTQFAMMIVPMVLPFVEQPAWAGIIMASPSAFLLFTAINLGTSVLVGFLTAAGYKQVRKRIEPFTSDLLLVLFIEITFVVILIGTAFIASAYSTTLTQEMQTYLGFDDNYVILAIKRIFRGGVVIGAFLLAAMSHADLRDLKYVAVSVALFGILSFLNYHGIHAYEMMDASALCIILAILFPSRISTLAIASGVAIFATFTGAFLKDKVPADWNELVLELYAIALLQVAVLIIARKAYRDHIDQEKSLAIRRLDAARDFADVGVFVHNLRTGMIQLDRTGRRILGIHCETTPFQKVFDQIDPEDLPLILGMRIDPKGNTEECTIRVKRPDGTVRTIHIFIWGERAESGATLAYGLVLDITEQQAQEDALRDTLRALSEKDEKQRRMFSIISHEIRTPASVIALLIEDLSTTKNTFKIQNLLREASEQLLSVLTDMRQAVNPEQNLPINRGPYSPVYLVENVRNTYSALAEHNGMRIVQSLEAGADALRIGDSNRIKQLLGNLVRNALIHSHGKTVEINFKHGTNDSGEPIACWTVSDDGIGIPVEDVERLFEPFERGNTDPRTQADGSGLGLYIVKTAVELLGGKIEYLPRAKGAAYRISIPDPLADPSLTAPRDIGEIANAFPDKTIVFAEDNDLVAEVTITRLKKHFAEVRHAKNGRIALEMIRDNPPDLVITDLFMPEVEGDELITKLRAEGFDFPVVGLTAAAVGNDMERFSKSGAGLILAKPINIKELMAYLSGIFTQ